MNDKELRIKVKYLKVFQGVSYKELADYLGIKQSSFNNWLHEQYDFSIDRKKLLFSIISDLEV